MFEKHPNAMYNIEAHDRTGSGLNLNEFRKTNIRAFRGRHLRSNAFGQLPTRTRISDRKAKSRDRRDIYPSINDEK